MKIIYMLFKYYAETFSTELNHSFRSVSLSLSICWEPNQTITLTSLELCEWIDEYPISGPHMLGEKIFFLSAISTIDKYVTNWLLDRQVYITHT